MTHHSVMTSSLLIKILKIDKFGDLSCDIDLTIGQTYLEMLSPLKLINMAPGSKARLFGHFMSANHAVQPNECLLIYHFSCRILNMKYFARKQLRNHSMTITIPIRPILFTSI